MLQWERRGLEEEDVKEDGITRTCKWHERKGKQREHFDWKTSWKEGNTWKVQDADRKKTFVMFIWAYPFTER